MESSLHGNDNNHRTYTENADVGDDEEVLLCKDNESQLGNSNSFSSSSESSSDEDFFQLDANELSKSLPEGNNPRLPPKPDKDTHLASVVDVRDNEKQPNLLSKANGFSNTSGFTHPPPIQVMGKSDLPDPYRIPSSVFARTKSTTPIEWSVASNESLFSIHPGNSSFSRDHVFLLGRSGELTNFPGTISGHPFPMVEPDTNNLEMGERSMDPAVTEAANAETMKEIIRAAAVNHCKEEVGPANGVPHSGSGSRRSDASGTSNCSFAFPILTEGRTGSIEVESEQQQQQQMKPTTTKATPNAAPMKWFPCFSCCSFCRSFCC
ncbi:uncharacterized protein LOC143846706 isoform X1 [Tasmannia lanceolata]|uniref:uncharacterized protein LOC143846706 isoform X1 n=1 Tax=Tasmannia lanceolata TaxID=3420 RepID=UPI0040646CBE